MHHPTNRIAHTTAFVTPVVEHWLEREIDQWVYLEVLNSHLHLSTLYFCVIKLRDNIIVPFMSMI